MAKKAKKSFHSGTVKKVITIKASKEKVWRKISNIVGLSTWLVDVTKTEYLSIKKKDVGAIRLITFANGIAPSMASVISFKVPIDNVIGPSMTLVSELQTLKTRMDEPKSRTVFVGNPNGPFIGPPEAS